MKAYLFTYLILATNMASAMLQEGNIVIIDAATGKRASLLEGYTNPRCPNEHLLFFYSGDKENMTEMQTFVTDKLLPKGENSFNDFFKKWNRVTENGIGYFYYDQENFGLNFVNSLGNVDFVMAGVSREESKEKSVLNIEEYQKAEGKPSLLGEFLAKGKHDCIVAYACRNDFSENTSFILNSALSKIENTTDPGLLVAAIQQAKIAQGIIFAVNFNKIIKSEPAAIPKVFMTPQMKAKIICWFKYFFRGAACAGVILGLCYLYSYYKLNLKP